MIPVITHNKSLMVIILLLIVHFMFPHAHSNAADTIKINLTYKHRINEINQTRGYVTISQKFYTMDDTLFREIRYDEQVGQISGYTFYYYRDTRLFSEEYFLADDQLDHVLIHAYDEKGNLVKTTRIGSDLNMKKSEARTVRKYNVNNAVVLKKVFIGSKKGATTRYRYSRDGKLIESKGIYTAAYDTTVSNEIRTYRYDGQNRINEIMFSGQDISNRPYEFRKEYVYNKKGLLTGIRTTDLQGVLLNEQVYRYMDSDALSIYQENDSDGNILLLLQFDYKKHFMEYGSQVSVFEAKE